jgi:hypothetical protein
MDPEFLPKRGRLAKRAFGGEEGIRTPGTLPGTPDFESGTFDHSVTSPPRNMAEPTADGQGQITRKSETEGPGNEVATRSKPRPKTETEETETEDRD